ncbi:hypothetical protein vseg_003788 [Gypsophila vaccaria]
MIEKFIGNRKARQLHRLIRHFKVTVLCLILTVVVLRGTIGAGKFGTPEQDFLELRNRFASRKFPFPHRVLVDVDVGHDRNSSLVTTQELRSSSSGGEGGVGRGNVVTPDDDELALLSSRSSSSGEVMRGGNVIRPDDDELALLSSRSSSSFSGEVVGGGNVVIRPRVLLVTGSLSLSLSRRCGNSLGDYYLLKSVKNKVDYCRLHGMEVLYNVSFLEAELSGFRAKLTLIRSVFLGHPEVEFVWWMDSDVLLTDMAVEVPWERYEGYNLVVHGSKETVVEGENWVGLSTGSFLIRNCRWSLDLIESWSEMGPSGKVRVQGGEISIREMKARSGFEVDEESTMMHLSVDEKEKWGGRVYLENDCYVRDSWEVLVSKYDTMLNNYKSGLGDYRWPLVTQFVGCKPCSKAGDYSNEKCLKEMERAFNFGDNQVVGMYGLTRNSLSSTRVKKVHNDMRSQHAVVGELVTKEVKVSSS